MSFWKSFEKLTKGAVDTALLPLDITKDLLTLGGACIDEDPATTERAAKIIKDLQEAYDELGKD